MRALNELKKEMNISILVLAHTPKVETSSPLTINSLAGSKHISNFADSVSAIGKSVQGSDIRYIKQVKPSRSAEMVYDSENTITCELVKDNNFLTFQFQGFEDERKHLRQPPTEDERNELIAEAYQLHIVGTSYADIAEKLLGDPKKKGTIHKWIKRFSVSKVSAVSKQETGNLENDGNGDIPF